MVNYPKPILPVNPILSWASFGNDRVKTIPSVLEAGAHRFLTSGRISIAMALKLMGIGAGNKVLVPAYYCTSMVNPVRWAGADYVLYRLHPDASVDLDDLKRKLDSKARVLLITHYFGFPQQSRLLRDFCDSHQLLLLEDCGHAFFGQQGGLPLGSYGDYAIASVMKFFPVFDGGCLISSRYPLDQIRLETAGAVFELKAIMDSLERAFAYRPSSLARFFLKLPLHLKRQLWSYIKARSQGGIPVTSYTPLASEGGIDFDAAWLNKAMSLCSRWVMKGASQKRIIEHRRSNFLRLLDALGTLPHCRPLHTDLPDTVVPYVFPLWVEKPEFIFPELKRKRVPILRWDFLADWIDPTICPVSADWALKLLQFPCHQELRPEELEWMITQIRETLLQQ